MLNIEVIKFEAQDVITASVAAPTEAACAHDGTFSFTFDFTVPGYVKDLTCDKCGEPGTGVYSDGTVIPNWD